MNIQTFALESYQLSIQLLGEENPRIINLIF